MHQTGDSCLSHTRGLPYILGGHHCFSISGSVTVSFTFITRVLRSATSFAIVISSRTSLTCRRFQGNSWQWLRNRCCGQESFRKIATIILLVVVETKLLAVVASTNKISMTSCMSITVSLSVPAWILWRATSSSVIISTGTSLIL